MTGGGRMTVREWSCMDYIVLPLAIFFMVFGACLLYVGFVQLGPIAILNPAWMFVIISIMQFRWLFKTVPTWKGGGDDIGWERGTQIAKDAAMKKPAVYGGNAQSLSSGSWIDAPYTYTRTLNQLAFDHIPLQITAGVDRQGNVVGVEYHLQDISITEAESNAWGNGWSDGR